MLAAEARKSKASLYASLIRPANSIMVGFAVIVGVGVASNSVHQIFTWTALFGFLTGFAISSFSMITNDIYDVEVDRVNRLNRPLATGRVSIGTAWTLSISYLLIGLLSSALLGVSTFAIACVFAFIGWAYNSYAKKLGLLGNSLVAASLAIPYIFGSISIGQITLNLAYLLALTSFLAGIGREVLKGISDVAGDKVRNVRSIAVIYGSVAAKRLTSAFFLTAVLSSSFPIIFSLLNRGNAFWIYVILILIPDSIFLYLTYRVLKMKKDDEARKLKTTALVGMMTGLVAYLLAGLA